MNHNYTMFAAILLGLARIVFLLSPTVSLTGANTATPTFTAPTVMTDTVLGFSLTVTDSVGVVSNNPATVSILVR